MTKAIVKRDLEAFDGTKIKKGETVDVYYGMFYDPKIGLVGKVSVGRRYITGVSIKDLKIL
jgi:hypothetical protein